MAIYESKKTFYDGKWFRSSLEARVARALNTLAIPYEYEKQKFEDGCFEHDCYTPDFYLPEQRVYIEAAGNWDNRHINQAANFYSFCDGGDKAPFYLAELASFDYPKGSCYYISIDSDGYLYDIRDDGKRSKTCFINRCTECNEFSFMSDYGFWGCPSCEAHDGDHYLRAKHNLFTAAGLQPWQK